MDVKSIGKSTYKAGAAMDSLAKTDDMLAVIGIIMLLGVIVSSYGAFWQGRLAQASYNDECKCEKPSEEKSAKKNTSFFLIAGELRQREFFNGSFYRTLFIPKLQTSSPFIVWAYISMCRHL